MPQVVKYFDDGSHLEFDKGRFDNYCVFSVDAGGHREAPTDSNYFQKLKTYGSEYGYERVYNDFVKVYDMTTNKVEKSVLEKITEIAKTYKNTCFDSMEMDRLLTILYMGMIAEECKENAIIGKRIKRLGMYSVLREYRTVRYASNFMRDMRASDLDKICKSKGF